MSKEMKNEALAFSLLFGINAFLNNDHLSLKLKQKSKLNLLAGHPKDVTECSLLKNLLVTLTINNVRILKDTLETKEM